MPVTVTGIAIAIVTINRDNTNCNSNQKAKASIALCVIATAISSDLYTLSFSNVNKPRDETRKNATKFPYGWL
jgi:hypothetical protein